MTTTQSPADSGTLNDVRPMTGAEYIESLRDDREVYYRGERVADVTTHPAFRNSVRSIARMYDTLHAPEMRGILAVPTDTGNGGYTHPFFKTAHTAEDLVLSRDAIVAWQREVYGWMGRSPDYKASFLGTLGANADFYGEYKQNALHWYKTCQERLLYLNHAIVHPPIDRDKPADETADICVHVDEETDSGLIVSGAKVVATGSAITNANFIAHYGLPLRKKEFGLVFTVPMDSPGLKLICRSSYEMNAAVMGTPFDYPLSSRFDENDSIMVFDRVLVPWENVFAYDVETSNNFVMRSGFLPRFVFHGCARLAVKLDFIAGCVMKAVEMTGTSGFRGVQMQIGEILNWRDMFWALSDAMAKSPQPWVNDTVQPNLNYGLAYRTFMGVGYPRVKEIIEQVVGSGLIYLNSHASDFGNPEIAKYLNQYVRGSNGVAAIDRIQLLKLLWDAVGSEFAGRHELYERNYGGDHEAVRFQTLFAYQGSGQDVALKGFAEQCMSEYDVNGWTRPDLINNDDLAIVTR
ncbi:MAG TPA: 4-hydroxyphenylacetate 3-hydroxylase N-terminal domain-containing protein [Gordonia sp. (in: high G+C Gram-positive bacteria)]|uniref:4-hydroxyphenylacetate 3-hydroxylase N-terminal domain-containing protein n=1 Tax=unclassified Gordonia (in: high G+C Gram-positive bacteria) TaxID=2657482 RepID=UPI0025BB65BC|nr:MULTISPECIES: 4-hydroxyphenylacetate 3-hydroxylase N-terminal domain-containing protein [unclassified Gordonia (in: high G+C Gram-positive bacteria)]HNP56593.1 4-hydroxyphenylacetate 3-hydroxylase N-terminal domain-containing protein [Gordonia sp. (in: high G+C Gram-positive bacteria)]HRC49682.1 4-hydroxyphenylacetate 3-hydroxylase N-terminal domain-containing protein [Gordonia sp. (in: high G+C Gram-positive bacteria)]